MTLIDRLMRAPSGRTALHKLTDAYIRNYAAPPNGSVKLFDGIGLYLEVKAPGPNRPTGSKLWRLKYRVGKSERRASYGQYPEITLTEARRRAQLDRVLIRKGIDPVQHRQAEQMAADAVAREAALLDASAFATVADGYFAAKSAKWSVTHRRDVTRMINEMKISLGTKPIGSLRKSDVLDMLKPIAERGARTYARDVLTYTSAIVRYYNAGADTPVADPTVGLREVLHEPGPPRHHAALQPEHMPAFLRAITLSDARPATRIALRIMLLTAVRTNELRSAKWSEFDLEDRLWKIPAERMKYRARLAEPHRVPLSTQAVDLLRSLHGQATRVSDYLFPNDRSDVQPMSENAILFMVYRMGYRGRMTGHGCRSVFSTWANEGGFNPDAIERQLAHVERSAVRAAYNRGAYMDERARMMQAWADQLDAWEHGPRVVAPADELRAAA